MPKVQGYVKSKFPDQMCIWAGWSAPLFSRYIDRISLDQVNNQFNKYIDRNLPFSFFPFPLHLKIFFLSNGCLFINIIVWMYGL